ncbi:LysR substrate-binding domain-containing protein [Pigmentiphaga litoralis]|uniref:DNA-binding transcriptional LysR family regulator n=1 Tax=Pigmentiphaga litoralis TaxID=516702 RepID=A0A7Y9IYI9_9BURK|nr:LysR substrate-binding domain-containing protein [Pigmentiphaga litoralis]NYE26263.1 DNA-binding transcriptional LysR family regulator [Pigmentiphaga litoralis]NYE85383.1 DNA-binding transcriptional LysR family regulator [Pigmentiphaga litoralis]
MRRRIPSMTALIAFDAAARHQSVTRAADELALTESAVSRQISLLEDQLQVRLFNRVKKRISLTRAGVVYAADVASTISRIERGTLEIMAHEGEGGILEIAALPTVGTQWLIPRLTSLYAERPDMTINVSARSNRFLFSETTLDGALYFGKASWPGAFSDYLFDEELVPVGHAKFLEGDARPDAHTLASYRLLHLMTRPEAWRAWCVEADVTHENVMRGPRFEIQSMLISAACAGQGVALLPRFLIADQLRSGKLKVLSDVSVRSEGAYYFSYPEDKADEPHLTFFRAWLQEQTRMFQPRATQARPRPGRAPSAR